MIPFVDLKKQYYSLKKTIDKSILDELSKTQFILGDSVSEFEEKFSRYQEVNHCIAVNSGTDALILGIRGLNLPPKSEIIIPTNTFIATALGATENGYKPVFVDIDENDYGINLDDFKKKINNQTKAVILIHLFGQPDKIDEVKNIIKKSNKNILLIEDCCQAHGARYKKKKVNNFGIFSAFSFYPGKNLGCYGDGGAITTNDSKLAKKYRLLRQYGSEKKYYHEMLGINSRLDTIQASILLVKLPHLDLWNKKRLELAQRYNYLLKKKLPFIKTPMIFDDRVSVFYVYVIRVPKRNELLKYLNENCVQTLVHYPIPLHLQKAFDYLKYKKGDFPIAERTANEIISLPVFPELTKTNQDKIVNTIVRFYEKNG